MSSNDVAIRVQAVSKHYLMFDRPEDRLKQSIVPRLQRLAGRTPRQYYRDFAALHDVSFEVKRGETVGIIGRNGSGKSTLLQIICGTLQPTHGTVEINGRVAALLELGAGFNPEFTGRENIYMQGAILGLSRQEIDQRFDAIAAFADIGHFIEQPVKIYSSGMYVRVAFAVSVCVDPDILVVDEALAVGDEAFQRKCFARIEQIQARGGTILFVSHGAQTIVQLCSRAMLIDGGELLLEGRPKTVVGQYQRLVNASAETAPAIRAEIRRAPTEEPTVSAVTVAPDMAIDENLPQSAPETKETNPEKSAGAFDPNLVPQSTIELESRGARIRDVRILTLNGQQVNILQLGRRYVYEYFVDFSSAATNVGFGMFIRTVEGLGLAGAHTIFSRTLRTKSVASGATAHVQFEFSCFMLPGTYFCNCGTFGTVASEPIVLHRIMDVLMFQVAPEPDMIAAGRFDIGAIPRIRLIARSG
jgi:lipopolysaccharide transport system ATP-binding protein